ncbi:adenylyltransferase/cytidyltransferase family protein [Candidatus Uhrbacteria bacterium]|nr:adenylyltransferase/cytidyltransferase family protein [Candidatus Uhrbacteria bacterium]
MNRVMVFGAFDGLHPGHEHFLTQAKSYGESLTVVLATDATIARLKGRAPVHPFAERSAALLASGLVDEVVAGDDAEGVYTAAAEQKPDTVVFGYDQEALKKDFIAWITRRGIGANIIVAAAHEPETYKSSLRRTPHI